MATPVAAEARYDVNRNDLDDDPVEEFPVPVLFGVDYDNLVPDFGDSRGGGTRSHEGQDMRAPQGTPVVSPTEAIVISTGEGVSAGKFVYTANPGGETFRYMHLDEIADNLRRGVELDEGDLIGTVGDTGNVPAGVYHLHFEVRDDRNRATDPYERMTGKPYTLKERVSFLRGILREVDDRDGYAELLVETFPDEFRTAFQRDYNLPHEIEELLEDSGVVESIDLMEQLMKLIATVPALIPTDLETGDSGVAVSLLQTYLIFHSEGAARDRLAAAGATAYFGPITAAAILEYQEDKNLPETGVFDARTKSKMM